ncbi:peptide deformylase [Brevibacillus humidisoli]|uniref:peptide deformylase n=1 Tax=Brevibacillus humidisoli TaxID=2895522 RepID=UPI001E4AFBC7|nr:peptide deformylase [Brevibacillus humidisoli]UFJ40751.1 peptide deformylase [Brevibacillus humidisoli]
MAERSIRKIGDPVLRAVCKPVPKITPNVLKLLDDMGETLYATPNRAGLAAPQVGIAKRIVVMDCGEGLIELINPEIVKTAGEQTGPEACLSIPGVYGYVKRARYVKVKTLTRSGDEVFYEGEDDLAVCMQHEIDHLNGVLYIDHVQQGQLFHEQSNKPLNVLEMINLSRRNTM